MIVERAKILFPISFLATSENALMLSLSSPLSTSRVYLPMISQTLSVCPFRRWSPGIIKIINTCLLKKFWDQDLREWRQHKIRDRFNYLWADGVHVNVRLGEDKKACLLVVIWVTEKGEKKLLGLEAGYRESKESWKSLFLDLQKRGLTSPLCIIGDGGLGLWGAIKELELFKETREQRCWFHKMGNVLNKLPKRLQGQRSLID